MPTVAKALLAMTPDGENAVRLRVSALWTLGLRKEAIALAQTISGDTALEWLRTLDRHSAVAELDVEALVASLLAGDLPLTNGALLSEIATLLDNNGHTLEALLLHHQSTVLEPTDEAIRERRRESFDQIRYSLDLEAQLAVLEGEGRYTPVRERTFILVPESRPFVESAVADWAHETALAHVGQGLDANVVTLLPHPWNLKPPNIPLKAVIDGIP
jgi:hypothetical protein